MIFRKRKKRKRRRLMMERKENRRDGIKYLRCIMKRNNRDDGQVRDKIRKTKFAIK